MQYLDILKNHAGELWKVTGRIMGVAVGILSTVTRGSEFPRQEAPPILQKQEIPRIPQEQEIPRIPQENEIGHQEDRRQAFPGQPEFISSLPSRVRFRQITSSNNIIDDIDDITDV